MSIRHFAGLVSAAVLASSATVASADVIFGSTPSYLNAWGGFNPTLATSWDGYAAVKFTITDPYILTSVSFTTYSSEGALSDLDVNWKVYEANGIGGNPGTLVDSDIASGGATPTYANACTTPSPKEGQPCTWSTHTFDVSTGDQLAPGTYFFALQGVSPSDDVYLGLSDGQRPMEYTTDGGITWNDLGEDVNPQAHGWAMTVNGSQPDDYVPGSHGVGGVPEPANWALMIIGFGMTGDFWRRHLRRVRKVPS